MSNQSPQYKTNHTSDVFAHLNQQDIEEFYIGYQRWHLQHQLELLQSQLANLRKQIGENAEHLQEVQPTAIELATLARLQSNGVSDVDLLDRMLEKGEWWLDRTMQRLDYLEQLDDFISDDYTQWCQHALEGAYDWIDSVLDGNPAPVPPDQSTEEQELTQTTEELLLEKLTQDEDETLMLETTLKRPSITIDEREESTSSTEETPTAVEVPPTSENTSQIHEEANPVDSSDMPAEEGNFREHAEVESSPNIEDQAAPELNSTVSKENQVRSHSRATIIRQQQSRPPKRPGFIRRFIWKIWGSSFRSRR